MTAYSITHNVNGWLTVARVGIQWLAFMIPKSSKLSMLKARHGGGSQAGPDMVSERQSESKRDSESNGCELMRAVKGSLCLRYVRSCCYGRLDAQSNLIW